MKPTLSIGFLLFVLIPRQGTCDKFNLTEEVKKYIENYIAYELVDYSLDKPVAGIKPTLKAEAGHVIYEDCRGTTSYFRDLNCSDFYIWYIYNSTVTPFNLSTDLEVSYKGERNVTHNVNLNNATSVHWNPENLTLPLKYPKTFSEKKCNFSIEITCRGLFVYDIRRPKGDKPGKNSFGIGHVADLNSKRLVKRGDDVLAYNISGVFQHTVTCKYDLERSSSETR
uniref:Putative da-p36 protein n=1 Tax=Rhipicephalus pulchellus TaxID=72859 RepID=L7LTI1_RHIPC